MFLLLNSLTSFRLPSRSMIAFRHLLTAHSCLIGILLLVMWGSLLMGMNLYSSGKSIRTLSLHSRIEEYTSFQRGFLQLSFALDKVSKLDLCRSKACGNTSCLCSLNRVESE